MPFEFQENGKLSGFDMAVSAIYITHERRKVVDLTDPYYRSGLVMIEKKQGCRRAAFRLPDAGHGL